MELTGKFLKLRRESSEDIIYLTKWLNNQDLAFLLQTGISFPTSYEKELELYKKRLTDNFGKFPTYIDYIVALKNSNICIGMLGCGKIDYKNGYASNTYIFFDKEQIKKNSKIPAGYLILESIILSLDYFFNDLRINRIEVETLDFNKNLINLVERIGFIKEGVLRQKVFKKNQFFNVYIYSLLKNEFNNNDLIKYYQYKFNI